MTPARRRLGFLGGIVVVLLAAIASANRAASERRRAIAQELCDQGRIHIERRQLKVALRLLTQAHKLDPSNVEALLYRGRIYEGSAHLREARSDFLAAHQLRPDDSAIALAVIGHSDYLPAEEVERFVRQALARFPEKTVLRFHLARALARQPGDARRREAIAEFQAAKTGMPDSTMARIELAQLHAANGAFRDARDNLLDARSILDRVVKSGDTLPLDAFEQWVSEHRTIAFHLSAVERELGNMGESRVALKLTAKLGQHAAELRQLRDRAGAVPADEQARARLQAIGARGQFFWADLTPLLPAVR